MERRNNYYTKDYTTNQNYTIHKYYNIIIINDHVIIMHGQKLNQRKSIKPS